jgi:hypothetical protein
MANNEFNFPRGWSLTGNAGTDPLTNYVGTSDNQDFVIKRNALQAGRIYASNATYGVGAGTATLTGIQCTLIGPGAGNKITSQNNVTAIGNNSLFNCIAQNNTALGNNAGSLTTNGQNNVFIGGTANAGASANGKCTVIGHGAATPAGDNMLNLANVLWGVNCSGTSTTAAGSLSVGATTPNSSAIFDLTSTSQGFGLPQLTNAAILAIATPKNGLMVYNTTINHPCFYNGTAWQRVSHSPM